MLSKNLLCAAMLLSSWPVSAGEPEKASDEAIISLGPRESLSDQVDFLMDTWRGNFAISVVAANGSPACKTMEDSDIESDRRTMYCWLSVHNVDAILTQWLTDDSGAPIDQFTIHYWYPKDQKVLEIAKDKKLVVLLAPTRGQGVFSANTVLSATPEQISLVRKTVRAALAKRFKQNHPTNR